MYRYQKIKLHCNIQIYNRLSKQESSIYSTMCATVQNIRHRLYLCIQKRQQFRSEDIKYRLTKNIKQVCKRFVADGKFTIQFLHPCHDISIETDPTEFYLKDFICALEKIHGDFLHKCKQSLIGRNKYKYKNLKDFPETIRQLYFNGLGKESFDERIFSLQNLKILDLSNNKISFLPIELGTLPNLKELYLSKNVLGISSYKWAWLEQDIIQEKLEILDISHNNLTRLPSEVTKLINLKSLKVRNNLLTKLPQSITNLKYLENLNIAGNNLSYLPGPMIYQGLHFLDISNNPLLHVNNLHFLRPKRTQTRTKFLFTEPEVPSLMKLAAKCIMSQRLKYKASLIPSVLVKYLEKIKYCHICESLCIDNYLRKFFLFPATKFPIMAPTITRTRNTAIMLEYYICSLKCNEINPAWLREFNGNFR